jgi:ketosteroid isomerase-like protein
VVPTPGASVSEENVNLHRLSVQAFNARDIETFVALCDPQIELHSTVTVPGGAVYNGHDGVRRWHRDLEDGWGDDLRIAPEAYFDLGEHTVTHHVLHGRGRESGADVSMPAAHVCRWRDGRMVYFKGYAHREDALSDLGTSEDAVDAIEP